ncbi:MAG: glycoside hydrolase family 88 protein, partial [Cyclobacteriaceae bacterium]|nr:glycoside hydrolase family 88 protein [Cyclobacteriaceae bacterium]
MKSIRQLTLILIIVGISGQLIAQKPSDKDIKKSMLKAYKWQQKNPKHDLNDWTNGAYYIGMTKAYQSTGNKTYAKGLKAMAESLDWMPRHRWYHADDITICQSYIYMEQDGVEGANLQPTVAVLDRVMSEDYNWNDDIRPIYWWWCDALFMGPPVFVHYG